MNAHTPALTAMTSTAVTATAGAARWRPTSTLGVGGDEGNVLNTPIDVAFTPGHALLVLNRCCAWKEQNPRITVTALDEPAQARTFGTWGHELGGLIDPSAIMVSRDGISYVADAATHTITAYDPDGAPMRRLGTPETPALTLSRPSGLAEGSTGEIWVSDSGNGRLVAFDPHGALLHVTPAAVELNEPWGLTIDDDGNIYIADWGADRVLVLDPTGAPHAERGIHLLHRPAGIAVDNDHLYVSDWGHHRVVVLTAEGELADMWPGGASLSTWAQEFLQDWPLVADTYTAAKGAGTLDELAAFVRPAGIAVGPAGTVCVADSGRHRIQVYAPEKP